MDGPDVKVELTTDEMGTEGSDHTATATWTALTSDGRETARVPDSATFTVVYRQSGLRRVYAADRQSTLGRVSRQGASLLLVFRLEQPGRVDIRASGSMGVNGVTLTKAADATVYARRSRVAA